MPKTPTSAAMVRLRQPAADRVQLTEAKVKAFRGRARRYRVLDGCCPGLVLHVLPSAEAGNCDARAYYVRGRIGGGRASPSIEHRLGDANRLTLATARRGALTILAQLRQGIDPRTPAPGTATVAELLDRYETDLGTRGIVKARDAMFSLRRGLKKHLRAPAGSLTRSACVLEIDALAKAGKPGAAQDFRKHVAVFLNWCVDKGHLHASPMAGFRQPRQTRSQRLAKRKLTFVGAGSLWRAWDAAAKAQSPIYRDLLRFGLLTGLRRDELAGLRWVHLTLTGNDPRIDLPAELTKTGEARSLPLGPISLALLHARLQHREGGTDLVFPGRGNVLMAGWTRRLAPVKAALGEDAFAHHALRRSYRSALSDLGVPLEIAELMIGHKRQGLLGTYDHSTVWPARVGAQAKWEAWFWLGAQTLGPWSVWLPALDTAGDVSAA